MPTEGGKNMAKNQKREDSKVTTIENLELSEVDEDDEGRPKPSEEDATDSIE